MQSSPPEHDAVRNVTELETALSEVEKQLDALGQALKDHDPAATELAATELHQALTRAVRHVGHAGQNGVPPALRRRLAMATGLVAAQRDAVARATSLLDRAIDVLLPTTPQAAPSVYGALGTTQRPASSGLAQA
jgi:hypothetical protein